MLGLFRKVEGGIDIIDVLLIHLFSGKAHCFAKAHKME